MELETIRREVDESVQIWNRISRYTPGPVELTSGARDTLTFLIDKINTDPSQAWEKYNADDVQRFAIASIPGILNDVTRRNARTNLKLLSTWELMHAMSSIIDHLCPIPKGN
jgi:hypothetical protein